MSGSTAKYCCNLRYICYRPPGGQAMCQSYGVPPCLFLTGLWSQGGLREVCWPITDQSAITAWWSLVSIMVNWVTVIWEINIVGFDVIIYWFNNHSLSSILLTSRASGRPLDAQTLKNHPSKFQNCQIQKASFKIVAIWYYMDCMNSVKCRVWNMAMVNIWVSYFSGETSIYLDCKFATINIYL